MNQETGQRGRSLAVCCSFFGALILLKSAPIMLGGGAVENSEMVSPGKRTPGHAWNKIKIDLKEAQADFRNEL